MFAFTSFVLEWGSMWYNLHNLYPTSGVLDLMYHVMMASSNAFGLVGGAWFVLNRSDGPQLWARGVYGVITVGVVIGRQHHALRDYRAARAKGAKAH